MKISGDPLRYCQNPPKGLRGILLYGPNRALIDEAALIVQNALFPNGMDDLAHVVLHGDSFKGKSTALADEMGSFGFFAAQKLIHVVDAGDSAAKAVTEVLSLPDAGHFLLLTAEALGPRSTLRMAAEKAGDLAALPCYEFDSAALTRFVQAQFQKQNARVDGDAAALICDRLGNNLSLLPGLIAQLINYSGNDTPRITIDMVEAVLVDQAEQQLDALVQATMDGRMEQFDRILHGLDDAGTSMIAALRTLQNYFYRLRLVHAHIQDGLAQEAAIAALRPPLFFKAKTGFMRHLSRWSPERVDRALAECLYLESQCKKTGTPELALVQQRLLRLMAAA